MQSKARSSVTFWPWDQTTSFEVQESWKSTDSQTIASLECKIIAYLWSLTWVCTYLVYTCLSWQESVGVFIGQHLLLELTMPKGKRVKSTSKSNVHDYFDRQSRKLKCILHWHYVRIQLKPLASKSTLSTVSCRWRESWMEVLKQEIYGKQKTCRCYVGHK